ncbi:MAG: hypothetical protein WCT01_04155 [Candidatus Shapirobacteria bacterium]|jgi:hypothetical protein
MKKFATFVLIALIALLLASCTGGFTSPGAARQQAPTPQATLAPAAPDCPTCDQQETPAPAPTSPVDDGSGEFRCTHVNPGRFMLRPGESANGGHIIIGKQDFLYVDDKIVVVTNDSSENVEIDSTDGVGVCNSTDKGLTVDMRFREGCDPDGCGAVLWVKITDSGIAEEVVQKPKG